MEWERLREWSPEIASTLWDIYVVQGIVGPANARRSVHPNGPPSKPQLGAFPFKDGRWEMETNYGAAWAYEFSVDLPWVGGWLSFSALVPAVAGFLAYPDFSTVPMDEVMPDVVSQLLVDTGRVWVPRHILTLTLPGTRTELGWNPYGEPVVAQLLFHEHAMPIPRSAGGAHAY